MALQQCPSLGVALAMVGVAKTPRLCVCACVYVCVCVSVPDVYKHCQLQASDLSHFRFPAEIDAQTHVPLELYRNRFV